MTATMAKRARAAASDSVGFTARNMKNSMAVTMTSATIILALLPAAIGLGAGSDTNGPLSIAVIGGLISSTLLTLVVVPSLYSLVEHRLER